MQSRISTILFATAVFSFVGAAVLYLTTMPSAAEESIWQTVDEAALAGRGFNRVIEPTAYRLVEADTVRLRDRLAQASFPDSLDGPNNGLILELPLPEGQNGRFLITRAEIMAPELAAQLPDVQTFRGQGIDDPTAVAVLDWTPHGFHAMILSAARTVYIDPYAQGTTNFYMSYDKGAAPDHPGVIELAPVFYEEKESSGDLKVSGGGISSGSDLRTYRLAVAATGEYTQFHGGTKPLGQAAIVTAVNRVAGIYEREVAVSFTIVANNMDVVYTNASTDPYTNSNGFAMLSQNQSNLDTVIGTAAYDVGHVFSTGGGGVAGVGVICNATNKARGVTGLPSPTGDPFYVDFVSHELGHQFSARHTFNSEDGFCAGNGTASSAYEPGSGSTIMAYAGICDADDLQSNSDDYFHVNSFDQIRSHVTVGSGAACGTVTPTGNTPPIADGGADGFTIPINTPFTLTGSGSDVDGGTLTYNWEQFDLGPAGSPNSPSGNAPIFRSFPASTSPSRTFPQWSDLVNNTQTLGEILPGYTRDLTFRLTVRDNQAGGGGVNYDEIGISVTNSAGPFLVTEPNTAVTWNYSTSQTVNWDVANTDQAPISCATVDIFLSIDGGLTYPITLLSGTANDGAATITVPNVDSTQARVQVACADNIFFDISDTNFSVSSAAPEPPTAVLVSGVTTGGTTIDYEFTASILPLTATIPITYEWTVTDYALISQTAEVDNSLDLNWSTPGTKTIVVEATNSAGSKTSEVFTVEIEAAELIFLPMQRVTP